MRQSKITIAEAAKRGFASRPTIYRKIKKGYLSAEKDAKGRNRLDVSELVRVFGEPSRGETPESVIKNNDVTIHLETKNEMLRAEVTRLTEEAQKEMARADREADRADRTLRMMEEQGKLLEDLRGKPAGKSFWGRIFGG